MRGHRFVHKPPGGHNIPHEDTFELRTIAPTIWLTWVVNDGISILQLLECRG